MGFSLGKFGSKKCSWIIFNNLPSPFPLIFFLEYYIWNVGPLIFNFLTVSLLFKTSMFIYGTIVKEYFTNEQTSLNEYKSEMYINPVYTKSKGQRNVFCIKVSNHLLHSCEGGRTNDEPFASTKKLRSVEVTQLPKVRWLICGSSCI